MKESDLIKKIDEIDYTPITTATFSILKQKYGYTLRVSMILQIIKDFIGTGEDFHLIDVRTCNNGLIESYLIDKQIDWQKGKEVNFSEIYREIEKVYSFSASEKRLLEDCKIEEKLWALYLALSKSSL